MIVNADGLKAYTKIIFTALYFFIYRGSIITAISWGAFQFITNKRFDFKKISFTLFVVAILPILLYSIFLESIYFFLNSIVDSQTVRAFIYIAAIVAFLGFFPNSVKHLWLLVALYLRNSKRRNPVNWLHPSLDNNFSSLPLRRFSLQMFIIFSLGAIVILACLFKYGFRLTHLGYNYFVTVFNIVYTSEIVALAHVAVKRQYFYPSNQPKMILYPRTIITIFFAILLPVSFGFLYYVICNSLTSYNLFCFIAWPFPIACNSILHLFARWKHWAPTDKHPEIYTEAPWTWWISTMLIPFWICYAFYLMTTNTIDYELFGP